MPRYKNETSEEVEVRASTALLGVVSLISAALISTGVLGALIWFNIFIWSKVF